LWRCVCEGVEPGILWVGEENVPVVVDEEVVDSVKIVAEVVIEQCDGLVGQRIESCDARPPFDAADTVVSSRDAPVYPIRYGQSLSLL